MPSFQMPSLGGNSTPGPASLAVESDPPGAQASAPGGGSCVTPCRLNVSTDAPFSVNVALDGYVPQTVPVRIMQPDDPRLESDQGGNSPRLDPNPVYVELERAAAPTAPAKKKKVAKPAPSAANQAPAAQPTASAPTTAAAPATAAPAAQGPGPSADSPWPMPR
jgi:hypothetical protein